MHPLMLSSACTVLPFNPEVDKASLGPRWCKWLSRFENYLVAMNISNSERKKALLLHYAGESVHDIYDTMKDDEDEYDDVKKKLTDYFEPKKNVLYEIFNFRQAKQMEDESIDSYVTRLRTLAKYCEFTDIEKEIQLQLVQHGLSGKLRRRAFKDTYKNTMSLDEMMDLARALETSEVQAEGIEKKVVSPAAEVQAVSEESASKEYRNKKKSDKKDKCEQCGYTCRGDRNCPAYGEECYACGGPNHFGKMCKSSKKKKKQYAKQRKYDKAKSSKKKYRVQQVSDSSSESDEDDYVFTVNEIDKGTTSSTPKTTIKLHIGKTRVPVEVIIDTGASVNLIDEATYKRMERRPTLRKTKARIHSYGANPIQTIGQFSAAVETEKKISPAKFHVVKGKTGCLLSYKTAEDLQLVLITNTVSEKEGETSMRDMTRKYADIFGGIGKLKDYQVKLYINEDVKPNIQPHRRIPFHIRKKVEKELKTLEEQDIIEKVPSEPTPWVSSVVVLPKADDQVRICIDMRQANEAIQRERHVTPTIDDIIHDLNGAKMFSKLDLKAGYHQLELHPDSRQITTFATHVDLWRYKR